MDAERLQRIEGIALEAMELPAEQRGAFLDEACAGAPELRADVEALLAADAQASRFLDAPTAWARAIPHGNGVSPDAASMTSSEMPDPGPRSGVLERGRKLAHYEIVETLGAGGMGEVYRATDTKLRRDVALKILPRGASGDSDSLARFRREARAVASLSHPNIVTLHSVEQADGENYLTMELVEGETLQRVLEDGPLAVERAVRIAREILSGLAAAHAAGIVHRDLKPGNVMLAAGDRDPRVKILDFGLAKRSSGLLQEEESLTVDGGILGTLSYMSPEQARGASLDHRSDLFAVGTLLYEMVTGCHPFRAVRPTETLTRICTRHPAPARSREVSVPAALSDLIDDLLAKDPGERPQTAEQVIARLGEAAPAGEGPRSSESEVPASGDAAPAGRPVAEHCQVTVMACELVDAGLAAPDLESLLAAAPRFQALAADAVARFDAHLGPVMGHRLLAYFGSPRAHEDDARRAVHAALDLAARISASDGEPLRGMAVRVAVHTGPALRMPAGAGEELALGQTLELVTGLRALAAPAGVLVSAATRALIEGFFELRPRAPVRLPGLEEPVEIYRVRGVRRDPGAAAVAPLVGREQELEMLAAGWRLVREGTGQVVLIQGEPGIGKSRLALALKEHVAARGGSCRVAHCSAFAESSPWHPIVELLRQVFGIDRRSDGPDAVERLAQGLAEKGFSPPGAVPLLAPLLSLPAGDRYPPPALSPEKRRVETLEILASLLLELAAPQPAVLVVEDLHWVDPSTLEVLALLIERVVPSRLLLVLTARTEFASPWDRSGVTRLVLDPLVDREVEALIDRVAGGKALPPEVSAQILEKTDGVPLFVEELTRSLLESDLLVAGEDGYQLAAIVGRPAVPPRLRDALAARLDRLGEAKQVAQLAAAIGRELSHALLAAVSPLAAPDLEAAVARLLRAEILYRRGFSSQASYVFKHALIQDTAYGSLVTGERRRLHREIARVLETEAPETARARPDLLAHHLTEADLPSQAIDYRLRAGQLAAERSAHSEAIVHLEKGLAAIDSITDPRQRAEKELGLLTVLAPVYMAVRGFVMPETEAAYVRAHELCRQVEEGPELFTVVYGLWQFRSVQAKAEEARKAAEELLALARRLDEPALLAAAFRAQGANAFWAGDFTSSKALVEQGIAVYDSEHSQVPGLDPGVMCLGYQAWGLWCLGFPDRAMVRVGEMVALAERLSQPFSLGFGLFFTAMCHQARREAASACEWAEKAAELANEHGFEALRRGVSTLHGWALAQLGRVEQGISAARWGLEHKSLVPRAWFHWMLAESWFWAGDGAAALAAAEEGLAILETTGERFWEAELRRLQGTLRADQGAPAVEVEACLRRAVDVARGQGARSLELRAATSLGRWWHERGRADEARDMLAAVYGTFTEGFGTRDLREAKALLEVLGPGDVIPGPSAY